MVCKDSAVRALSGFIELDSVVPNVGRLQLLSDALRYVAGCLADL